MGVRIHCSSLSCGIGASITERPLSHGGYRTLSSRARERGTIAPGVFTLRHPKTYVARYRDILCELGSYILRDTPKTLTIKGARPQTDN